MKKIYLITTKGCEGCSIMKNILIDVFNKDNIKIIDIADVPNWIKINIKLTDFPTTILVKDDVIKYHFSGTKNVKKIKDIVADVGF